MLNEARQICGPGSQLLSFRAKSAALWRGDLKEAKNLGQRMTAAGVEVGTGEEAGTARARARTLSRARCPTPGRRRFGATRFVETSCSHCWQGLLEEWPGDQVEGKDVHMNAVCRSDPIFGNGLK